jgi:hypothetical protein
MPPATDEDSAPAGGRSPTARRELRFAVAGLVAGVVVLPFAIYVAGAATLGPYEGGLAPFLGKLYGDLAHGAPGALALVAGPYVVFQLLRLTTRPLRRRRS